ELRGWISGAGDDARIVMESGWTVDENGGYAAPYFNSDIGLLWALELHRELIGASPSEGFTTFSFVNIGNGVAFGKRFTELSPEEFRHQLETYNVGALILWSAEAKDYAGNMEGIVPLQRSDPFGFFGVAGDHSFLKAGRARSIHAAQDCIAIRDAEPGQLIVKYHYFETLRTDPPIPIGPAPLNNGDPNPFIRIDNDQKHDVFIYNAGFTGLGRRA